MIPSISIGSRTLLNDCNHSATTIFWRSATEMEPFSWLNNWLTTEDRRSCPDSQTTLAAHFAPSSVLLVGLFLSSTVQKCESLCH